jgi:polyisoprenyl-teichoic acid--peptidoglycan teichoic acid transferase
VSDSERPEEEPAGHPGEHGPPDDEGPPDQEGPREEDAPRDRRPDGGLETGETTRLGLTEEFNRIESEIEREGGEEPPTGGGEPIGAETGEWAVESVADDEPEEEWPEDADWAEGDEQWVDDGDRAVDDAPGLDAEGDGPPGEGSHAPADEDASPADEDRALEDEDLAASGGEDVERDHSPAVGDEHATVVPPPAGAQRPVPPPQRSPASVGTGALGAAAGARGGPAARAGAIAEEDLDPGTPSLALRFLAGSMLIVASVATAVAVTGLLFLSDVAARLQPIPGIQQQLAQVDPGAPQTILIIGSDRRAGTPKEDQRSDTTMLLRVDPEKKVLSLFSLPRDLKVDIPGVGVGKLNEAYAEGGEKLTLKTVKRFTGLEINHVVEINFAGFADAVNAIDCVYIDVDRKYFNDNAGLGPDEEYAEIDIGAGYRRLCGLKALQYVRYRHSDTDIVRAARQQDFLREARQKVEPRQLLGAVFGTGTGNELINIFTDYTRSDINDEDDVIGILKSFASMRSVPVNEVHFQGDIGGPDDPFVTSTDKQVKRAIDEFLNGVGSEGKRGGGGGGGQKGGGEKKKEKRNKNPAAGANVESTESLADPTGRFPTLAERFEADARKNSRRLRIPVFYPTEVVPGSTFSTDSRSYDYKNEQDKREQAYKTVIPFTLPSGQVEYYGAMGTSWSDPPILRNPSETRKIGGREYELFYDGGRLRLVGWSEKGNSYWLSNTLTQSIGEAEMLAVATSMREI